MATAILAALTVEVSHRATARGQVRTSQVDKGRQAGRQGEVHHTASRLEAEVAYAGYGRARAAIGG